jgi:hypothetical protein
LELQSSILTFGGVVDVVDGGHFGSLYGFCVSLYFFLREGERVVNLSAYLSLHDWPKSGNSPITLGYRP